MEKPRSGVPLRLNMTLSAFRAVLSKRAQHVEHSGGMEAHGLTLGMRWLARKRVSHSSRVVFLVDATAVRGAGQKGRTSAPTLTTALRRCAALSLACDWQTHLAYVPSESNAADWPSRGLRRKQEAKRYHGPKRPDGKVIKYNMSKPEKRLHDFMIKQQRQQKWLSQWCAKHLNADNIDSIMPNVVTTSDSTPRNDVVGEDVEDASSDW